MNNKCKFFLILTLAFLLTPQIHAQNDFIFKENPKEHHVRLHKTSSAETPYRIITYIDPRGTSVELDDGATWTIVGKTSAKTVQGWRENDSIVIHPTMYEFWGGTSFYLYNERTKTSAYSDLSSKGPLIGQHTHIIITDINLNYGQITTTDATGRSNIWTIDSSDLQKLNNWNINQTIILGFNENCYAGWLSNHSYILINVEKYDYIEASLL